MKDFRKLEVWEKSHRLTLEVYKATATFPKDELYGLTSQIRRAGASKKHGLTARNIFEYAKELLEIKR